METVKLGEFVLVKMSVQEYNKTWGGNAQEQYGQELEHIVWLEQYKEDRLVGMSEENMLIFADNTFAYTSRGTVQKCNLHKALEVIKWIEEL